jgi:F-type H+-transporting ATPase subunit delta
VAETEAEQSSNGELRTDAVSQVYAEALFEMAEASDELESVAQEVDELGRLLREETSLRGLLSSPALGEEARRALIERVFQGQVSDVLYRFMQVVNQKGRLSSLPGITRAFATLVAERKGIVEADVWAPQPLDQQQIDQLGQRLAKALGVSQVVPRVHKDTSLIGGLKIRVGDKLIDASLATQLKRLRQRMAHRGREQARELRSVEEE